MKRFVIFIICMVYLSGCTIVVLKDGSMVTAPGKLNEQEIYALNEKYMSDNASKPINTRFLRPFSGWDPFYTGYMYPYDHFYGFYDPFYVGFYPYYWYRYPYPSYYYYDFEDYLEDIYGGKDFLDAFEDLRDARSDVLREVREGFEDWVEYRRDRRNDRIDRINDLLDDRREFRLNRQEHFRDAVNDVSRNIRHMRENRINRRRGFFPIR